jgi:transposase InsO family protein
VIQPGALWASWPALPGEPIRVPGTDDISHKTLKLLGSPPFLAGGLGKQAIIGFHLKNPLEGSRRLTFMMLDADVVAVSPTSVWRVLGQAGLLSKWNGKPSKKGTGFEQPLAAHQHWHIDVSYINISGTFYYLCSIMDGCSRYIVNCDLRESMTEADIEVILERAKELHPQAKPRIISDNGPQFIAKDFKEFIRISGMIHVRTSPYLPSATSPRRTCSPGVSRRSTPSGIGSWRKRENSGRFVGSGPREERRGR